MTRQEALDKLNRANSLKIHGRLALDKFREPLNGSMFYKDIDPGFLEDIRNITGTELGIEVTDSTYRLLVNANRMSSWDPVVSYVLVFDKKGNYIKISDIVYQFDLESDVFVAGESLKATYKEILTQMQKSIRGVTYRAYERGYLIDAG